MKTKHQMDQNGPFFVGGAHVFMSAAVTLTVPGIDFSPYTLCDLFNQACDDVRHLRENFGNFWEKIDPERIDLSEFSTSLYDVVLHELQVPTEKISSETRQKWAYLWLVRSSKEISLAMTHFLRYILRHLKANPALVK